MLYTNHRIAPQCRRDTSQQEIIGMLKLEHTPERAAVIAGLAHDGESLTIRWADGRQSRFPAVWLLDNRPDGRHGALGQRRFDVAELPEDPQIASAALTENGDVTVAFAPADAARTFAPAWLREHALDAESRAGRRAVPKLWDKTLGQRLPAASYRDVAANERALAGWLAGIRDYGFSL